jgi:hypothetical protein
VGVDGALAACGGLEREVALGGAIYSGGLGVRGARGSADGQGLGVRAPSHATRIRRRCGAVSRGVGAARRDGSGSGGVSRGGGVTRDVGTDLTCGATDEYIPGHDLTRRTTV